MAKLAPPPPTNQDVSSRQFRDWFYSIFQFVNQQSGTLGTMAFENANSVAITVGSIGGVGISGSTINNTPIGNTTPSTGAFTSALTRDGYTVKPNCYIEAYDRTASIALTTTPTILAPASTVAGSTGITYNSSTGVFTFAEEGDYTLSLSLNLTATSANQVVYVYSDSNTGSGFTPIANSGKYYQLTNGVTTQFVTPQAVHRSAGQQIRYWIWSSGTRSSLTTQTLPTVTPTVYVPAIRLQYS